jgi:hypothetical protein
VSIASSGIQSRTLRVRLRMLVRAYGAQESDCISAAFGDIPDEAIDTPPHEAAEEYGSDSKVDKGSNRVSNSRAQRRSGQSPRIDATL